MAQALTHHPDLVIDDLVVDLVIDGAVRPATSGTRLEIWDPATTELIAEVAAAGQADVQAAIDTARAVQPFWAGLPPAERGRQLHAVANRMRALGEHLARIESVDTGKPLSQARTEVTLATEQFDFCARLAGTPCRDAAALQSGDLPFALREADGVTAHLTTWNHPLQIAARTTAPALMTGNTCVLAPAEEAPLTTLVLGALAVEAGLPAGVLNVVTGSQETAPVSLAGSADVDHLSLIGGPDTHREITSVAARNVKPMTVELGRKPLSIVLRNADLERAVPVLTGEILQNAGQSSRAASRVLVHRSRHIELLDRLVGAFAEVRLGRGLDDPDLGSLISSSQLKRVLDFFRLASADGGRIVFGGNRATVDGLDGHFVQPTVIEGLCPGRPCYDKEVPGPVVSVLAYDSDAEAVDIANATPYGPATELWASDGERALQLARRVKSGQVFINAIGPSRRSPLAVRNQPSLDRTLGGRDNLGVQWVIDEWAMGPTQGTASD